MARPVPTLGSLLVVVATACAAAAAQAADHVVGGAHLTLRHAASGGALSLVLRGPAVPIPAPGGADDPSSVGLVVTLFGRGSGEQASLAAPPGAGSPGWRVRSAPRVSYAYADPGVRAGSAQLMTASLREIPGIRVRAKWSGLTLASPEGAVAVRVSVGSTRICALFDPPSVRRDGSRLFLARDADAAGLASCDDDALAGVGCEESAACGGTCPGDSVCAGDDFGLGCTCVSPHQPCGGSWPACNGECPEGEACADLGGAPYSSCGCLPAMSTPCGDVHPSCGDGDCPLGTSCIAETFVCCGGVQIESCACRSGPPPSQCPGGCPGGWTCTPPAPGQQPICIPPFCSGGSGFPACDGSCSLAGTECRSIGSLCFCLEPCSGGGPFPACGGSCDPGEVCVAAEGQCFCT